MDTRKCRGWMSFPTVTAEFLEGLNSFLDFAFQGKLSTDKVLCPYRKCVNYYYKNRIELYDHLVVHGFMVGYTTWYCHGESMVTQQPTLDI